MRNHRRTHFQPITKYVTKRGNHTKANSMFIIANDTEWKSLVQSITTHHFSLTVTEISIDTAAIPRRIIAIS